jgi:hypothetical protein
VHAFAVTQRGHHGADAPAGGYDIDQLAADALGFLSGSCGPPRAPMGCS